MARLALTLAQLEQFQVEVEVASTGYVPWHATSGSSILVHRDGSGIWAYAHLSAPSQVLQLEVQVGTRPAGPPLYYYYYYRDLTGPSMGVLSPSP